VAHQAVFATVDTLDLELLPRFDPTLLPNFGRQDDLTL
jgi:hypothetical protein